MLSYIKQNEITGCFFTVLQTKSTDAFSFNRTDLMLFCRTVGSRVMALPTATDTVISLCLCNNVANFIFSMACSRAEMNRRHKIDQQQLISNSIK